MDQVWSGIRRESSCCGTNIEKSQRLLRTRARPRPQETCCSSFFQRERRAVDLQHIRVIYYDVNDPFWGQKLLSKVAENILSAIENPEEAILPGELGE